MALIDDLLASLVGDARVDRVWVGPYWTAVVSRHCGLAGTQLPAHLPHGRPAVAEPGSLAGRGARELAELARSESVLERGIGLAALNSLLDVDESRCIEVNAADLLAERGRGRHVAVVGHFPFVSRLRDVVGRLSVLELRPGEGDLPAERAAEVVPEADVVAITGSALINGTLEGLLDLCRPGAWVMVLGPSTPLSPVLFEHGVDVVSGTRVVDVELALRCIGEGANFRQVRGVRLLSMARGCPR